MPITISESDYAILRDLVNDYCSDCPLVDSDTLQGFAERLGIWGPKLPPTAEELARREAFAKSEAGQQFARLVRATQEVLAKEMAEQALTKSFFDGPQWDGTTSLRIRLPKDYAAKAK